MVEASAGEKQKRPTYAVYFFIARNAAATVLQ
jgi:hypothetical protein